MFNQYHYTYYHNNILSILLINLSEDTHLFSDTEVKHTLGERIIHCIIWTTNEKKNIVIVQSTHIILIELVIPFESSIKIRHEFKRKHMLC